jgi:uncharacterized protein (TIGR01244 family)
MQINRITPEYSVAAQIAVSDVGEIAAAGFKSLICNRPDGEIESDLYAQVMEAEALKHGLEFTNNPISNSGMTMDNLASQADAISSANGPVFAYCRSGTRCTICWAFINAGHKPISDIVELAASAGYDLSKLRPQLEAMAEQV